MTLGTSALNPLTLLGYHLSCTFISLVEGSRLFESGTPATAVYALKEGMVELVKRNGEKACYHTGEVFCLQDVVWHLGNHSADALARTDVEVLSLEPLNFLHMLYHHPTLALWLIGQQDNSLWDHRANGAQRTT
jgi:CRP-like cAMP-binding protein